MDWMDLCLSSFSKADVKDISLVAAKKLLKLSVKKKKKHCKLIRLQTVVIFAIFLFETSKMVQKFKNDVAKIEHFFSSGSAIT